MARRWRVWRIVLGTLLCMVAVVVWGFSLNATHPALQIGLFAVGLGVVLAALWPYWGVACMLGAVMAMGGTADHPGFGVWSAVFLVLATTGLFRVFHRVPTLAWITASLPFWALSDVVHAFIFVALGMVWFGLLRGAFAPFRMIRPRADCIPAPHLAGGPLVDVEPRTWRYRSGARLLRIVLPLCALAVLAGAVLWVRGSIEGGFGLVLTGVSVAASLGLAVWLGSRSVYHVDAEGVSGRVFFRLVRIRWTRVSELRLVLQAMPFLGLRFLYYCVESPDGVVAFVTTLSGGHELRDVIERATGMRWPDPDFQPTTR